MRFIKDRQSPMLHYTIKRVFHSLLVILGTLLLTFVLFKVAAGDPTATVLGKNPSPREIEDMRRSLGADKPLLYGKWRKTELYSTASFKDGRNAPNGVSIEGPVENTPEGLLLKNGAKLRFDRNFRAESDRTLVTAECNEPLLINGVEAKRSWGVLTAEIESAPSIEISPASVTATIAGIHFERPVDNPFNSQMSSSIREIIDIAAQFPFVSFFNFGDTLLTREPIRGILWRGLWPSLALMVPIFIGEMLAGMALAMIACAFRGSWIDKSVLLLSVAGMSISYIAMIIFGQWFLSYRLNLLPVWGWGDLKTLILPVAIGIVSGTGGGVRFYRTVFLNEMSKEYLRTAVAKGCNPLNVYCRHMLKNAMIPIMTRASTVLPFLFTGSLLLESFFGIPGLGYAGINALNNADIQTLKALVIVGAFLFVAINLLTDLAYAWADPRIRLDR